MKPARSSLLVLGIIATASCGGGGSGGKALIPPQLLSATSGEPNQVTLTWTPAPNATSYNIYWSTAPGVTRASGTQIPGAASPHVHTGLTEGVTYYYVVTSVQPSKESAESMEVWGTPGGSGVLDPTFGGSGWITHAGAAGGSSTDYGYGVAVDTLGRIVVAGSSNNVNLDPDMVIWQLNEDGTLDLTFNAQGYLVHHNAAGGNGIDNGFDVVLDANGRILVTGASLNSAGNYDMVVWAVTSTGAFDPTFGPGGFMVHDGAAGGASHDQALGINVDGSGNILVTGSSMNVNGDQDMVVWRLTPGGMPDTTFAGQGWAVFDHGGGAGGSDGGFDVAVDASGRIIVAGQTWIPFGTFDMTAWRLNPDGSPDTSFGGQGWVIRDGPAGGSGTDRAQGIASSPLGVILGGHGMNPAGDHDLALLRFTAAGSPDPLFGTAGVATFDGGSEDYGHAIALDATGRLLLTGYIRNGMGNDDMAIWRYDASGVLDPSFHHQGWVVHDNAAGGHDNDQGRDITVDGSGRIVVVGYSRNQSLDYDMVVWRYR